ncbi:7,8-didemethyl-8-hydroxy-5-deazariboflavin synthase subunit CofG [Candidatus Synechococcus calcipolaris G9]|uniref:7,8-didemethyl-8-hydroxy-5-deazariboflavin synthase n=1 Tax=Candidatus Synechococcus calcipolaris G9 TaxID=1497997 RepID=A0ABT6EU75_9SYNE|nr:7,8-didemethyl-8-hydroxy-5-deazariboflavin synthase subunit CofG [Candidatus Synechococcus calcipolaris]MDG2989440.1 7,8-didemethyl-8-hydroxy-5-deazariboflavin synthase subunit CofG [Candidatus Synechococcus calcipolaris G9]
MALPTMAPQRITYSPAFTLVPTYECFNRCTYCNFRQEIGQASWLSIDQATQILKSLQGKETIEILILSGEVHPQSRHRSTWVDHSFHIAQLALEYGFLPHTNIGPLSRLEMEKLRTVNVSMGLMLEQLTPTLLDTVHRHAPSKDPHLRLGQLEQAGALGIPFTTGLLLGLGETAQDWQDTLGAIAASFHRWGHIQEVILQPYRSGQTQLAPLPDFPLDQLPQVVAIARSILPAEITIQIPPNLVNHPGILLDCLAAGARDLGGIVPQDHVNPDYDHAPLSILKQLLANQGWQLQPRFPVYTPWKFQFSQEVQDRLDTWYQPISPDQA